MRLLIDGRFTFKPVTGAERYATEMVAALRQLGTDDEIAVALPQSSRFAGGALGHLWEQTQVARKDARAADMLLGLSNWCPIVPLKWRLVVLHDLLTVTAPDAFSPAYRTAHQLFLKAIRLDSKVIVTTSSESEKPALDQFFDRDVSVLPCGVNPPQDLQLDRYRTAVREQLGYNTPFVLHVGAHDPRKNAAFVQSLAQPLASQGIRTVIVARRANRAFTDVALRPAGGTTILWDVSDDSLWGLYAEAAALLHPSAAEGFGLPLLEATSVGTPFVSTAVGAAVSLAIREIQIQPLEIRRWADAVVDLAAIRATLAPELRQRASTYRWSSSASNLLEICHRAGRI